MLMFISFGFIRRGTLCYSGVFWMDYIILVCLGGLYDTGVFWTIILVCFGRLYWCVLVGHFGVFGWNPCIRQSPSLVNRGKYEY